MAGTDRFVSANGLNLHYVEYGDPAKPALVCLHGFGGHGHAWDTFAAQVSGRYRVLAPTARGHGDSDRGTYDSIESVQDTAALIDGTGAAPAVVCGHSMGGITAIGLAALHPEKVAKLIIIDIGPETDPAGIERIAAGIRNAPEAFDTMDEAMQSRRLGMQGIAEDELRPYIEYDMVRGEDGKLRRKTDPALLQAFGAATDEQREELSKLLWTVCGLIKCPALIVRGSRTDILPRAVAERMLEVTPGAQLVEIDAAHMVQLEHPAAFYDAVKSFLSTDGGTD